MIHSIPPVASARLIRCGYLLLFFVFLFLPLATVAVFAFNEGT